MYRELLCPSFESQVFQESKKAKKHAIIDVFNSLDELTKQTISERISSKQPSFYSQQYVQKREYGSNFFCSAMNRSIFWYFLFFTLTK